MKITKNTGIGADSSNVGVGESIGGGTGNSGIHRQILLEGPGI